MTTASLDKGISATELLPSSSCLWLLVLVAWLDLATVPTLGRATMPTDFTMAAVADLRSFINDIIYLVYG